MLQMTRNLSHYPECRGWSKEIAVNGAFYFRSSCLVEAGEYAEVSMHYLRTPIFRERYRSLAMCYLR